MMTGWQLQPCYHLNPQRFFNLGTSPNSSNFRISCRNMQRIDWTDVGICMSHTPKIKWLIKRYVKYYLHLMTPNLTNFISKKCHDSHQILSSIIQVMTIVDGEISILVPESWDLGCGNAIKRFYLFLSCRSRTLAFVTAPWMLIIQYLTV